MFNMTFTSGFGVLKSAVEPFPTTPVNGISAGMFRINIESDSNVLDSQTFGSDEPSYHAGMFEGYLKSFQRRQDEMSSLGFKTIGYDEYGFENVIVKRFLHHHSYEPIHEIIGDGFKQTVQRKNWSQISLMEFTLQALKGHFELLPSKLRDKLIKLKASQLD